MRMSNTVLGVNWRVIVLRFVKFEETYQAGYGDRQESEEFLERGQSQDQRQEKQ